MIREILTLVIERQPASYYIIFTKERNRFVFQPTLNSKSNPSFILLVQNNEIVQDGTPVDDKVFKQAKEKVKEIISNSIFDQL